MGTELKLDHQSWQESGWGWYAAVQARRRMDAFYAQQEQFVRAFFEEQARRAVQEVGRPLRVLEFGCAFGRHLRYLRRMGGLEVYGCEQSAAMLSVARTLLCEGHPEMEGRLVQVSPHERLPYGDGYFDIVYTVAALMRVNPEDLDQCVGELRRVAGDMVLHVGLPSTPRSFLWDEVRGCWMHDLIGAHQTAGPCAVEVDTDCLAPRATVYKVKPAEANAVRVLSQGQWHERPDDVLTGTVEAALEFARSCRMRAQNSSDSRVKQAEGLAAERGAELAALKRTRAARLSAWAANHPSVARLGAATFDAASRAGRLLKRFSAALPGGAGARPD
jgi:SAM-dependent methyltransferase